METECLINDDQRCSIGDAIAKLLSDDYLFYADKINFKNYGANSSRTRTIVIGVRRDLCNHISPIELFPDRKPTQTLYETIGSLKSLTQMGEIDEEDIFHSFRPYPDYMRTWIECLGEGESAFDNNEASRIPYKIGKDGGIIVNQNKTGDKYKRQIWDKVAPSVHTRNDQLASQNTIHPKDDRVFSIRELMRMMSIPDSFKWVSPDIKKLNQMTFEKKTEFLKREESNIRKCIGEAVPTEIFRNIAKLMKVFLESSQRKDSFIYALIKEKMLEQPENLLQFIKNNKKKGGDNYDFATLSRISELACTKRNERAAYYTEKETLNEIFQHLPKIDKEQIRILEPAVGSGNFIPFIIKKYSYAKELYIDVIDVDDNVITVFKELRKMYKLPYNVKIKVRKANFLKVKSSCRYDLVIGNPPFINYAKSTGLHKFREDFSDTIAKNSATFFVYKAMQIADYVAYILPKNFFCNPDCFNARRFIANKRIEKIIDFGTKGFHGVHIETVFMLINTIGRGGKVFVKSLSEKTSNKQNQKYITDSRLPTWVIYRNEKFDNLLEQKMFNVFNVYRDRQITKTLTTNGNNIWVIKSRNIARDGSELQHIKGYDSYICRAELESKHIAKYLERDDVFLVPNMTYYPRMIRKPREVVANGSVAILSLKEGCEITDDDIKFFASDEFEEFYRVARNHATRSLNIDSGTIYYFCIKQS
jgi:DNA (cytosine-5)-methyltransferase 1